MRACPRACVPLVSTTPAWFNNNTIRYNNISHTVGSSSSDGQHVCVHGVPDEGCRRLVWGIYLDGGEAGITIHGNIIGASLHGAVFDNAGGNNTQVRWEAMDSERLQRAFP
jgi:hypothetical protein